MAQQLWFTPMIVGWKQEEIVLFATTEQPKDGLMLEKAWVAIHAHSWFALAKETLSANIVRWLHSHRNLYMPYRLLEKMALFWEAFSGKRFICCALIVLYSIDSTVGWSIASISNLGGIFTSALHASVIMSPWVWYIGYRPPYRTIYITYFGSFQLPSSVNWLMKAVSISLFTARYCLKGRIKG